MIPVISAIFPLHGELKYGDAAAGSCASSPSAGLAEVSMGSMTVSEELGLVRYSNLPLEIISEVKCKAARHELLPTL